MEKIRRLLERCKCGVFISVNEHRDYYLTAEQRIADEKIKVSDNIRREMIARNTIIELHFYPNMPVSYHEVYHYDLDLALDEALKLLEAQDATTPNT
jgi:hypothetical protein